MKTDTLTFPLTPMLKKALAACEPGEKLRLTIDGTLQDSEDGEVSIAATSVTKQYLDEHGEPQEEQANEPADETDTGAETDAAAGETDAGDAGEGDPIQYALAQRGKQMGKM